MDSDKGRMHRLAEKGIEEFHRFAVMFLYLWMVFALFVLNEYVIAGRTHNHLALQGFAFINAAVLGKVMLIAEDLKLGRRFEHRPLFWSVLYKSCLFALVFIVFHIAERVTIGMLAGGSARASVPQIGGGSWDGIAAAWAAIAVSLLPFFALREISRVLGKDVLWKLMFRHSAKDRPRAFAPAGAATPGGDGGRS
jgi:hypothetical protein